MVKIYKLNSIVRCLPTLLLLWYQWALFISDFYYKIKQAQGVESC